MKEKRNRIEQQRTTTATKSASVFKWNKENQFTQILLISHTYAVTYIPLCSELNEAWR